MSLALTSRSLPLRDAAGLIAALRAVGVPRVVLLDPPPAVRGWRGELSAGGVSVVAAALDADALDGWDPARAAAALEPLAAVASALRAPHVVCGGGRVPGATGAGLAMLHDRLARGGTARAGAADAEAETLRARVRAERANVREGLVERVARALHAPLAGGVPLAVVPGAAAHDLLHLDETGWLLDALPRLTLWFDPVRALALARLGLGPEPLAWADRFATRVSGLFVHGLGSDGRGHAHPEDDGPPWGRLAESLPQRVPWALDLSGRLSTSDLRDAVRSLGAAVREPGG